VSHASHSALSVSLSVALALSLALALGLGGASAQASTSDAGSDAGPPTPGRKAAASRRPPLVSPEIAPDLRVTFRLRAPEATSVEVDCACALARGKGAGGSRVPLRRDAEGLWSVTIGPVDPGLYEYSFRVQGLRVIDPANPLVKPQRWPAVSILEVPGLPALPTELGAVPHGTLHVHVYHSATAGRARRLHVFTPPGYESGRGPRLPVLYLLHGYSDNDGAWSVHGRAHVMLENLLAAGQARPMIIVMPDGHPVPPERQSGAVLEDIPENSEVFVRELALEIVPFVDKLYRTRPEAGSRAVVGLSMGGHQALRAGLDHPDRFAWIGAFSAAAPAPGVFDSKRLNARLRWLWIACGKDDFLLEKNEAFVAALRAQGVKHEWRITEGDHSWPVWRRYLLEILPRLWKPDAPARSLR
jgi:enterochelin esterase-like enzyme